MSRKDELLKLAQLFHSQALRAETPDANGLCIEWANATKTKLPMRRIAAPNDNGNSGNSIATPSRLHKPVELFREFVWAAVAL